MMIWRRILAVLVILGGLSYATDVIEHFPHSTSWEVISKAGVVVIILWFAYDVADSVWRKDRSHGDPD